MTPLDVHTCPLEGIRLIEASAGTGKTWNLCGLYARLLLEQGLTVQEILVVTFTNAATAELKERIRARLADLRDALAGQRVADPFVVALLPRLLEQREEQQKRLDLALESFDQAAIHTIHGFCQRALADVPFAAGLPLNLELVEDDREEREEAARDFWRRRLQAPDLDPELAACLVAAGDRPETHARLLQRRLARPLTREIWPEAPADEGEATDPTPLHGELLACWRQQREDILAILEAALPGLKANIYKAESVAAAAQGWDAFCLAGDPLAPLAEKMDLLTVGRLKNGVKKNQEAPVHAFFALAEDYLNARAALERRLRRRRLDLLREMLDATSRATRTEKQSRRRAAFDDLLFNLHERLADGRHPWLAPLLAQRWPAALIDEFQDTDPLQLAIFRALHAAGGQALFLVGDPKQAIYGFRHADLQTYLRARSLADAEYALADNQRSSAGLIAALNHLFSRNPAAFLLEGLQYQPVNFGAKPRPPFRDAADDGGDLRVWLLDDGVNLPDKETARQAAAATTAGEIARLLGAGDIHIGERPLRPADVAVLVRSHVQGAQIKAALARLGLGSVELSRDGVFQSEEAEDLERVLRATLEPGRAGLVRAALAGRLHGLDAAALEALAVDESAFAERLQRFAEDRDVWLRRGFGPCFRRLLARENVAARLLARSDGERRLTNYLHLGELLQRAGERHAAPEALLRHLESQRREDVAGEASQLRLESDRDLVQILTIHKAKGLEYPIVFCPYAWDGGGHPGGGLEGREYHDAQGLPVIDWRPEAQDDETIGEARRREGAAEDLRLLYVAFTRAVYRLYLVAGSYSSRNSAAESGKSLLHWLLAGAGIRPEAWFQSGRGAAELHAAWRELGRHPQVAVGPLPEFPDTPAPRAGPAPEGLRARPAPVAIAPAWRLGSFSSLGHGAQREPAARDHDARAAAASGPVPPETAADDILRFPRGAAAGDCLHALLEAADFQNRETWEAAIAQALARHPQNLPEAALAPMLRRLLADVTASPLLPGLHLAAVPSRQRLAEMEFHLPATQLDDDALNALLGDLGLPAPRLTFGRLAGYLKGYIDLVFQHGGRYYVLDWKSNYLGHQPRDYDQPAMAAAMAEHGYHLQALLYALALHRHLGRRLPDYQPEAHFGGVIHLFIRGVRPHWRTPEGRTCGVFFQRPGEGVLQRLEAVLGL